MKGGQDAIIKNKVTRMTLGCALYLPIAIIIFTSSVNIFKNIFFSFLHKIFFPKILVLYLLKLLYLHSFLKYTVTFIYKILSFYFKNYNFVREILILIRCSLFLKPTHNIAMLQCCQKWYTLIILLDDTFVSRDTVPKQPDSNKT